MTDVPIFPVPRCQLGETPIWSAQENALYWIDCEAAVVFRRNLIGGEIIRWHAPSHVEGLVLREGGGVLAVLRLGVFALDASLNGPRLLAPPPFNSEFLFLHEARCDPAGRLWVGLISTAAHERGPTNMDLYRLDGDRLVIQPTGIIGSVANGLAWNRQGTCLYIADSILRTVWKFAYSVAHGTLSDKTVFAQFGPEDGFPDGAAVDSEDGYWVAMAGGGKIIRLHADGSSHRSIDVPTALPTAMAFGGPTLERMYVTSIGSPNFLPDVPRGPHDGCLFELNPAAKGLPEARFRG
jgi:L-arabinonolactonase